VQGKDWGNACSRERQKWILRFFSLSAVGFAGGIQTNLAREYEEMKKSGELRKRMVKKAITPRWEKLVKIFGTIFLLMGITLIVLIIYSALFGYK